MRSFELNLLGVSRELTIPPRKSGENPTFAAKSVPREIMLRGGRQHKFFGDLESQSGSRFCTMACINSHSSSLQLSYDMWQSNDEKFCGFIADLDILLAI